MKAPDKIYLQVCGECQEKDCKNCKFEDLEDNVTWCKDRIYKKDVEYIRKDTLLKVIETARKAAVIQKNFNNCPAEQEVRIDVYDYVVNKIKSL